MARKIIKRIAQLGGLDFQRYNKSRTEYRRLFKKYKEFTMIPEELFISNLELCSRVLSIDGDIVECGVWRGGMSAAITELAGAGREIHLFDSFEGLPPAKEIDGKDALRWQLDTTSAGYFNNCMADESFAITAMQKTGHSNYRLWRGWFAETIPNYDGNKIAILRLDGDWYDSIKTCLNGLFPKVVDGGLVILDDYYTWEGCTKAVHDYLSESQSPSRIFQWNNQVAFIVKKS
ncbi:MAG: class I SAM-dependent methyltransferase [Cyclobacteriaceae bacterium]|nr:class I SAM-dependent methyltransferase [Cyclobacteriaceae bacterium]